MGWSMRTTTSAYISPFPVPTHPGNKHLMRLGFSPKSDTIPDPKNFGSGNILYLIPSCMLGLVPIGLYSRVAKYSGCVNQKLPFGFSKTTCTRNPARDKIEDALE